MAREYSVNRETLRKVIHEDLGLKSLKRQTVHHLTPTLQVKRLERCKRLLRRLVNEDYEQILFSDEKIFTVEEATNRQNDRIIASSCKDIPESIKFIDRVQKPLSVVVWDGVSADSRTKLIFLPQGVKINSQTYRELILEPVIKSAGSSLFKNTPWIFQQDSAPAHASKATQSWLLGENIDFLSKEEWPPSSPDLNPLDYSVWGTLQSRACATPHRNLGSLGKALITEWEKIPQEELRKSVQRFQGRLKAVVKAKGGYIE
ncbi:Transposase [Oopsacas minuta]|uniref:Transposase n=1 Tax=Oopsacas minuta TaxID=111878 RepID=A0AAV7K7E3_9METZ|nr:Transposase [Oopsacas minuta]